MADIATDAADDFIAKWSGVTASELSTAQSFAIDLCHLLGVDPPHPDAEQRYMFERPVTFQRGDGSTSPGRIDLYRRGCFVLEAKKLRQTTASKSFDDALLRARSQAEQYARALPAGEGRVPFLIVVDVGNRIELYAEFTCSGATYTPFPDPGSHRIRLQDLRKPAVRERLRKIWTDPFALDPSRESARVTRDIAARLAKLARSLEADGHAPESVAQFLMRCLFTMFAEDVALLPAESFRDLLIQHAAKPETAMRMLGALWRDMDTGGFSTAIASDVLRFNGKLFKTPDTLPLTRAQVELLIEAAHAKWEHVEPAIFGTLLERALSPVDRHKLGAHYTPRAYVERLVLPTVIEPLRGEWSDAQAAALTLDAEGKHDAAVAELRRFHHRLCTVRVLDPACGSGNFLYVTLEHLKRLEGEVLNALDELGYGQIGLAIDGTRADAQAGETVDPHQLLGIELNPRAAAIAEVVLWIGYLQWHFRTRGDVSPPQPVVRDFHNIENRDAVLACERVEYVTDDAGKPVSRWDGVTMKPSPVTGEDIPDDSARVPLERYVSPQKAAWPAADFVVGNPPFIGNKRMRVALGDGYVDALRGAWPDVPESADFVMYWWHHAAKLTCNDAMRQFGFITTNSIRQTFNRRIIDAAMKDKKRPLSLVFAIPDHPWVDAADGAAVRIAMTTGRCADGAGRLLDVTNESTNVLGEAEVELHEQRGLIHSDLRVGANVASVVSLQANDKLSNRGVIPHGEGMIVTEDQATALGLHRIPGLEKHLRPYRNGRDLTQTSRDVRVIDLFGFSAAEVRARFPEVYQWLLERVKPDRDENKRASVRERWWIFAEPRKIMRNAHVGLDRFIATIQTAKHRFFVFLDASILPDDKLIAVASDDAWILGVLSSSLHVAWALRAGGHLGVGNDPVYNKSTCFDCFPFPAATDTQRARLRDLGEQLDAHRKRQQAAHADLTLTGMYNVLEKLRSGDTLTTRERSIHAHGLVSVLRQLHDELDAAVLDAYGWSDLTPLLHAAHGGDAAASHAPAHADADARNSTDGAAARAFEDAILERLVALNAERAAEEARGQVRWLRPAFQNPQAEAAPEQGEMADNRAQQDASAQAIKAGKTPWPKDAVAQVRAVSDALASSPVPLSVDDITLRFKARGPWKKRVPQLLDMLVAVGRARAEGEHFTAT